MSLSHLLKSRLAFSTLLNQEGGIFSAFYNATRVLQRSLAPEIGGKKGSWFPNIHTTSQSSPMQAYNQSINDLDKELDHLKSGFEVLRMEGMLVDEYGRCEDPIREMEGMLVDEYGSNASAIQLAGLLSSQIYDFSNNVSPADLTRTLVDSETSTVTPSGLMSYFCGEPDALAYGKAELLKFSKDY